MRKISFVQVLFFMGCLSLALSLSGLTLKFVIGQFNLGSFKSLVYLFTGLFFLYLYAIVFYRIILRIEPLTPGPVAPDSRKEFVYHVYLLFFLILFYPVMRSGFIPVPLMRLFYLALGAKLGVNTYSSGIIQDPIFVEVGDNSLIGMDALITPHVIENDRIEHHPIRIGHGVTIGAHSILLAGVTVGDGAIVAAGAVVKKGTTIAAGEVWGGVPAKCIKN